MKIILIHGGLGECDAKTHWFPYAKRKFTEAGIKVVAKDFPDPVKCDFNEWYKFLKDECTPDEDSILIGHSMGACLALRWAQENTCGGIIMVGGFYTDQGDEEIKRSGFVDVDWDWNAVKENTGFIVTYASDDDPYTPQSEFDQLDTLTGAEAYCFKGVGHFGTEDDPVDSFPHLVSVVLSKV